VPVEGSCAVKSLSVLSLIVEPARKRSLCLASLRPTYPLTLEDSTARKLPDYACEMDLSLSALPPAKRSPRTQTIMQISVVTRLSFTPVSLAGETLLQLFRTIIAVNVVNAVSRFVTPFYNHFTAYCIADSLSRIAEQR
jgi:hypothetical protein